MSSIIKGLLLLITYLLISSIVLMFGLKNYIENNYPNGANIEFSKNSLTINNDSVFESVLKIENISSYLIISAIFTLTIFIVVFKEDFNILKTEFKNSVINKKILAAFVFVLISFSAVTIAFSLMDDYKPFLGLSGNFINYTFLILSIGIIYPIIEEIIFRYFILDGLQKITNTTIAVIVSSFMFSIVHAQYSSGVLFLIFLYGITFCYFRLKTKSLLLPIALHSINNILTLIIDGKY